MIILEVLVIQINVKEKAALDKASGRVQQRGTRLRETGEGESSLEHNKLRLLRNALPIPVIPPPPLSRKEENKSYGYISSVRD